MNVVFYLALVLNRHMDRLFTCSSPGDPLFLQLICPSHIFRKNKSQGKLCYAIFGIGLGASYSFELKIHVNLALDSFQIHPGCATFELKWEDKFVLRIQIRFVLGSKKMKLSPRILKIAFIGVFPCQNFSAWLGKQNSNLRFRQRSKSKNLILVLDRTILGGTSTNNASLPYSVYV